MKNFAVLLSYDKMKVARIARAITVATLLVTPGTAFAQVNSVQTWIATAPETDPNHLTTRPLSDVKLVTHYFDGLGRPAQTVARQGSLETSTGNNYDLVSVMGYDNIGRQNITYLPFVANTTDGSYQSSAVTAQAAYYNNGTNPIAGQGETGANAHSLINFESSPLNRPVMTLAPGNSWVGNGVGSHTDYYSNTSTDDVRMWSVTNAAIGSFGTYTMGSYPVGVLEKTVTTDENANQVISFKDVEGRVVLKKVAAGAVPDNGSGSGYNGWLCTYYIYDILGNLRAVIQPTGVQALAGNGWSLTPTILAEQCFRYEYDQRNRMMMKQVPGAQPVYMVYDVLDRLVLSQDGNLRAASKWLVTVYDNLNRPIETGLYGSSGNLGQIQSLVAGQSVGSMTTPNLVLSNASTSGNYVAANSIQLANGFSSLGGGTFSATIAPAGSTSGVPGYADPTAGFELLTYTGYDNYNGLNGVSGAFIGTWNSNFSATSTSSFPYPEFPTQNNVETTQGLVTWKEVKVLNNNNPTTYLFTSYIYDDKGRVIQTQSQNYSGGTDVASTQYAWSGQPLVEVNSQQKNGSNAQTNVLVSNLSYDVENRLLSISKTLNGQAGTITKTIVNQAYDQLGELRTKTLGPTSSPSGGPIDALTYDYNIRGWLLGIDRAYLNSATTIAITNADPSPGNYFGEELAYDKLGSYSGLSYAANQMNGNIAGTVWKSTGDAVNRKYDFTYDQANRLTAANFSQITPANGQVVDYTVTIPGYDANGNILYMNQKGYRLGAPAGMVDQLAYNYYAGTNRLQNVVDAANNSQTIAGDFRSSTTYMTTLGNNKTAAAYDYAYDNNGNLVTDQNKDIGVLNNSTGFVVSSGIVYNYLNLPQTITFNNNKGTVNYIYDAAGNKLQKITNEISGTINYNGTSYSGTQITTTTSYMGDFVYQGISFPNNSTLNTSPLQHGDILQFIGHEEGRIRPLYTNLTNSNTVTGYAVDYFLKDHLGDIRMVLTDEQATDPAYLATMETANATTEQAFFANLPSTRVTKPGAFDNQSSNQYVALTNFNTNKMGPSLMLKVMAGDKLAMSVNAYYNSTSGTNDNIGTLLATDLLTNLLSGATGIPALGGERATLSDLQSNSGVLGTSGQAFLNSRTPANTNVPKAYLNYIFLDDQFQFAGGYASPVTAACATSAQTITGQYPQVAVPKNGYVYIYVSNESDYNVYFDNLQVVYAHGPILEDNAYYPFGLSMAGISDKAVKPNYAENKYRWNKGSELQNKEFSDGSGLEMYETNLRELDPQLGRWWQIDSKPHEMFSPYSAMVDDPILYSDPVGDTTWVYNQNGNSLGVVPDRLKNQVHYIKTDGDPSQQINTKGLSKKELNALGKSFREKSIAFIGSKTISDMHKIDAFSEKNNKEVGFVGIVGKDKEIRLNALSTNGNVSNKAPLEQQINDKFPSAGEQSSLFLFGHTHFSNGFTYGGSNPQNDLGFPSPNDGSGGDYGNFLYRNNDGSQKGPSPALLVTKYGVTVYGSKQDYSNNAYLLYQSLKQ